MDTRNSKDVLDYDDPVPDVVEVNEPLTATVVRRLVEQRAGGVKVGAAVSAESLARLTEIARHGS